MNIDKDKKGEENRPMEGEGIEKREGGVVCKGWNVTYMYIGTREICREKIFHFIKSLHKN